MVNAANTTANVNRVASQRAPTVPFDMNELLLDIIQRAQQSMPFDSGGLYLYDPGHNMLMPHAYVGDSSLIISSVPLGESVVGRVAQRLTAEIVGEANGDARVAFLDPESRSEMAVPVVFKGELLGVFNVESHRPNAYNEIHQAMLQMLADHTALMIYTLRRYQTLASNHNALLDATRARRRETAALQRLAMITSSTLNLNEMLTNAVRETAELLDCAGAQLLIPDHIANVLSIHESSAYGVARSWPITVWPLDGIGYLVDTYHTGQVFVSYDPPQEAGAGCDNVLAIPLNTRQRTLGVLHLINQRDNLFAEPQIELAQAIANQVAVSMSSAQMLVTERRRADMMNQINRISQQLYATLEPQTLLYKAAQSIHEMLGHEAVYVYLLSESGADLELKASIASSPRLRLPDDFAVPAGQNIVGRAVETGATQLIGDVRGDSDYVPYEAQSFHRLQSSLVVPLRQGDEIIGAIDVSSTQLNAFTELERHALETLCTQVSIALENAQLYHQAQRRLIEQSIVHQIGQDLTAILNYSELSQAMVEHMNRALNTSRCLVGLYEPQHEAMRVEADYRTPYGPPPNKTLVAGKLLPLTQHDVLRQAITGRSPVVAYRDDSDTPPDVRDWLTDLDAHSLLVLPMAAGERELGVVIWMDMVPGRVFAPDDIQLAQTLVSQATIAIDNALLFRQLETRALELAEANRLRSQFLATISHELRTPMNSIIGFSNTLLNNLYGELNDQQASRIARIERNGQTLLTLIDDLLDLSKIDAGRMKLALEPVNLGDAILTVVQSMEGQAHDQGLTIDLAVPDDLPLVQCDSQRVTQVITNLLSNAIKFTPEGGITITGQVVDRDGQAMVAVTVTDTGIGISPENQAIIFDEFRQADGSSTRTFGGTGLGLAITRKLLEMMDGSIHLTSELNQGSSFTFELPVATA